MPRPGQLRAAATDGLSDRIALALLMRTFPPDAVDRVIAECGRTERRSRLLPARTVVYFILAICLFAQHSYDQVARRLAEAMSWVTRQDGCPPAAPTSAAISRARVRLGPEPLAALFAQAARDARARRTEERCARYPGWRVLAADATALGVPDTPENRARYGCPSITGAGSAALPQAHLAALAECGSHAITRAALGRPPAGTGRALTNDLLAALTRGDLLLADCGPADLELLPAIRAAGADVLWRAGPRPAPPESAVLPEHTALPDGSSLCDVRCGPARPRTEVRVLDDPPHRLITTLVDHEAHPAPVLRALYRERWGIRASLEAVGTLRRDTLPVLRSRWPGGVEQELWGHLLVHHTIHPLLHPA
ncbi:IS4 family transposase [Streptomyces sp. WAC 01529]|uniref:IS4 family transposase n=1 Tax=Streptomyces sp. WAC 01529 TaxID=2203205 RepID=UPI000F6D0D8A|nr:IS4 family transposase [Streptomyces sp. WAC 01529]AZM52412.1 IS4 family transposase [Streptomyces sp. WAC 01529]